MSDEDQEPPRRGPGRPPGPCNERELAQRRAAPRTHGEFAATGVPGVGPCKSSTCPAEGGYPCDVKSAIEGRGGALSQCLVEGGRGDEIERFKRALETGDIGPLRALTAELLAGQYAVAADNLAKLYTEGLSLDQDLFGKEGDFLGSRTIENPRGPLTLKILDMVGATAGQQALTPKAGAEARRDESLSRMLEADFIRQRRAPKALGDADASS